MNNKIDSTYLLRVEGVNLGPYVFGTRDLSTVRGASLSLLEAIPDLAKALGKGGSCCSGCRTVSQGASAGLFRVETSDPAQLRTNVEGFLRKKFPHATFVYDLVAFPDDGDFRQASEALLAANRWNQTKALSLAVPPENSGSPMSKPACGLDGVSPANDTHGTPNRGSDKESFISARTHSLRTFGQDRRQSFYQRFMDPNTDLQFAEHFEEIAKYQGQEPLNNKMAVFYADGNGFGKLQTRVCRTIGQQALFDLFVRSTREDFLKEFLRQAPKGPAWGNGDKLRFETLLWGGDEMIFVMPARFGWWFAKLFFEQLGGKNLKDAAFPEESPWKDTKATLPDEVLTYTASLIFCHHHAPIDRIKKLASDTMAGFGKGVKDGRRLDQLVYAVLESFDHLGPDFASAAKTRYGSAVDPETLLLRGRDGKTLSGVLDEFASAAQSLREPDSGFARSQLRRLMQDLLLPECADPLAEAAFDQRPTKAFRNASAPAKVGLKNLSQNLAATPLAAWIHLEELWDYAIT